MNPRKILAIKLRSMGDTILMTSPLEMLRRAYPHAEIHVAVTSTWAPLLENHPAIDRLWACERHKERGARAKAIARLALKLRREGYDCVANFHASPSSAMLAFATGARTRSIHFHGHKDKNRHSTVIVPGKGTLKPIIERDMDTVRALGVSAPAGTLPKVYLLTEETEEASSQLASFGLTGPILGIGLGSSRPTKTWPVERFAEVAVRWCKETGGSVLIPTGPNDEVPLHAFSTALAQVPGIDEVSSRVVTRQNIPLRPLAAILSQLAVFAGNDSGPRHLAVAVGTPTVTLFGPEHPFEWHPYPEDRHPKFFIDHLPCRRDAMPGMPAWCGLHNCIAEAHKCMSMIEAGPVFDAIRRVSRG